MWLFPVLLAASFWSRKSFAPLPSLSNVWRTQPWLETPVLSSPRTISPLPFLGGDTQAIPVQTPKEQRLVTGNSTSMTCEIGGVSILHWYRHLPGKPLKRILYVWGQSPTFDDSRDSKRFKVQKHPSKPHYDLQIDSLTPMDSGTYYCAYWRYEGSTELDGER